MLVFCDIESCWHYSVSNQINDTEKYISCIAVSATVYIFLHANKYKNICKLIKMPNKFFREESKYKKLWLFSTKHAIFYSCRREEISTNNSKISCTLCNQTSLSFQCNLLPSFLPVAIYISQLLSQICSSHYYSHLSPKPHVYKKRLILLLGKVPEEVYDGSRRGHFFETERCVQRLPHCITGVAFTPAAVLGNKLKRLLPSHGISSTLLHLLWMFCNSNITSPLSWCIRNQ